MADTAAPVKRGNVFTNKIGPLPMWAWVAIIGGVIILWSLYQRNKSGQQAAAATSASTTPPDVFMVSPEQTTAGTSSATPSTTPPVQPGGPDKDGGTPPEKHHRHKRRPHPAGHGDAEEKKETAFVQGREKHVGEYGSEAYRKKYGRTWRETHPVRRHHG